MSPEHLQISIQNICNFMREPWMFYSSEKIPPSWIKSYNTFFNSENYTDVNFVFFFRDGKFRHSYLGMVIPPHIWLFHPYILFIKVSTFDFWIKDSILKKKAIFQEIFAFRELILFREPFWNFVTQCGFSWRLVIFCSRFRHHTF